jgi:hypothetical protein
MCGITIAEAKNTSSSVRHGPSCSGVQGGEGGLVLQQPQFQLLRAVEHAIQRIQADAAEGDQLDHRLEGNREHQPFVLLAVAMCREPKKMVNRVISAQKARATRC